MDFESPDVEKDFPGLYASETGRKSNESDFSDGGDHEKPSKKDLLGRRKDKKESKKDRGYAALAGESSPEEDTDTNPSKSKKTKSFKFPTKSKEKREKSRDKEKVLEDVSKHKELNEKEKRKEKEREKEREKEKKEKEKREKLKEKDKEKEEKAKFKLESKEKLKDDKKEKVKETKEKVKDKEKEKVKEKDKEKVKEKEKDKKDKKLTKVPSTVTSGVPFEEIFTLGVALPIFGVPLQQSVERSRCHDDTGLPLVVRDSIDFLQANLKSNQLYRVEPDKIKLQQLRKLYTDRGPTFPYHWDVPVACFMLKMFIGELPESILTQELHGQFEQATAISEPQRESTMVALINKLPSCNLALVGWVMRHLECVLANEPTNHVNIQTLCTYLCPALGVSQNLLTYLVNKAEKMFPDVYLTKYVPPLLSIPPDFPENANEISTELRKQESVLNQIHSEMHAGVVTADRDQQLWEAQRIVTQLKRKLRLVQKSVEPTSLPLQQHSIDDKQDEQQNEQTDEDKKQDTPNDLTDSKETESELKSDIQDPTFPVDFDSQTEFPVEFESHTEFPVEFDSQTEFPVEFEDNFEFKEKENEIEVEKPKLTEKELKVLRLQLENAEYLQLKSLLQAKINSEQFEIVKLRSHVALKNKQEGQKEKEICQEDIELKQRLLKENAMLEQKRLTLVNQIFQERVACIQLKIELAMKEIMSKS
ncbi:ralA-binding protein 1 isoform X2 [Pieris rapae]|uniref:ralA-binding protein 1 isoform X2 n=1 Tax=Pieris rapae TaxID=64459 RepID=UPI001E27FB04|nr:ralA-binding protein 1 isoform X2 [Pieris rapae]